MPHVAFNNTQHPQICMDGVAQRGGIIDMIKSGPKPAKIAGAPNQKDDLKLVGQISNQGYNFKKEESQSNQTAIYGQNGLGAWYVARGGE